MTRWATQKRVAEERARREQQKRKLAVEREAETKRLAANLQEAHVKVKQELAEGGQGGTAAGGADAEGTEGFSVRKRPKAASSAGEGSAKTEAPPR